MSTSLLRCELLHVDGRTYRALSSPAGRHPQQQQHYEEAAGWEEEEEGAAGWDGGGEAGADEAAAVPIRQEGDAFVARMHLDAELYPYLIGRQGATRRQLEQDTGASVQIPGRGAKVAPVVITAPSRAAVARACTQLELLVSNALAARGPRALDYNFFLCLPLANPELSARFARWRDGVLAEPGAAAAGLEPSVFMHPQHLHLTICMLKLEERRELARQTLAALGPAAAQLLGGAPLAVQLQGLESMTDDPSAMHVMYADVRDAPSSPGRLQRLQQLCAAVVAAFSQAGLVLPQDERAVKLHATLINTRYRQRSGGGGSGAQGEAQQGQPGQPRREQRQPFGGRGLLERHAAADFGTVQLPAVHISQRGAYDERTGFYRCFASLALR